MVRIRGHDGGHVLPPFSANVCLRDGIPLFFTGELHIGKELIERSVQENGIGVNPVLLQGLFQLWPDRLVAVGIFPMLIGMNVHEEGFTYHNLDLVAPVLCFFGTNGKEGGVWELLPAVYRFRFDWNLFERNAEKGFDAGKGFFLTQGKIFKANREQVFRLGSRVKNRGLVQPTGRSQDIDVVGLVAGNCEVRQIVGQVRIEDGITWVTYPVDVADVGKQSHNPRIDQGGFR